MNLIEFEGQTTVIAKEQPEYLPMPARVDRSDPECRVTCCWQLTPEEIKRIVETGVVWHQILTFGGPLQPQLLVVERPF